MGKPYLKPPTYEGDVLAVIVGVTGILTGQVIMTMDRETARNVASHMMNVPVPELNDMAISAVGELANMILGNAATISRRRTSRWRSLLRISYRHQPELSVSESQPICVPVEYEETPLKSI